MHTHSKPFITYKQKTQFKYFPSKNQCTSPYIMSDIATSSRISIKKPITRTQKISTSIRLQINPKKRLSGYDCITKAKTPRLSIVPIQFTEPNQKNDMKYFDSLVHKYQQSDLKKTIIVDNNGNNNLNISPKRIKSNTGLLFRLKKFDSLKLNLNRRSNKLRTQANSPINKSGSLFDMNTSISREKKHIIIFDKKNLEEIENTTISKNQINDTLSFDTISISSFNENDKTMDQNDIVPVPLYSPRELLNKY